MEFECDKESRLFWMMVYANITAMQFHPGYLKTTDRDLSPEAIGQIADRAMAPYLVRFGKEHKCQPGSQVEPQSSET